MVQEVRRVGDIVAVVAVRVRDGNAAWRPSAEEQPVEDAHRVGDVDRVPDDGQRVSGFNRRSTVRISSAPTRTSRPDDVSSQ